MNKKQKFKIGDKIYKLQEVCEVSNYPYISYILRDEFGFEHKSSGAGYKKLDDNKPVVSQVAIDFYQKHHNIVSFADFLDVAEGFESFEGDYSHPLKEPELKKWLLSDGKEKELEKMQALFTLLVYEPDSVQVKSEPKYKVRLKMTDQYLCQNLNGEYTFADYDFDLFTEEILKEEFKELLDNPMFELIQEN